VPPPELATARLRLRPRTLADLEANLAMDLDPAVQRYIFIHGPPDPEAQRQALRQRIQSGWPPQGCIWVVEWRDRPGFLGWCGVIPLEDSGLIELGYRYIRAAWGRGIATEAARAVVDHAFRALGIDPLVAVAHPENRASRRVLEKLGFRYDGLRLCYGADLAFHTLERPADLSSGPTEGPPSPRPG
jgi:RimJ/RimL family protein N-acetyltransferase